MIPGIGENIFKLKTKKNQTVTTIRNATMRS
jgi:hypothetical protein